jgi:hypothetical protein
MPAALIENDRANNADLVRLVMDGRILLGATGIAAPTGVDWNPATDLASGDRVDFGYYSEDGFSLTPEPGDNKNFKAHNEDVVIDIDGPGTWAVAFQAFEQKKEVVEAYFDASVDDATGRMVVSKASVATYRDLVTVGITGDNEVIVTHYPRVKVADREALQFGPSAINSYGMTFRAFRDPVLGYHFASWSSHLIATTPDAPTIASASPAAEQAEAGNVIITGAGFSGATSVKFGAAAALFTINSDTQITAIMPAGAAGTANIKVAIGAVESTSFTYARS